MTDTDEKKPFKGMQAFRKAFGFVFSNIPHLLQTSILTLFLIVLYEVFLYLLGIEGFDKFSSYDSNSNVSFDEMFPQITPSYLTALLGSFVISIILSGIFAVRWHRSTLYGPEGEDTGFGFEFSRSLRIYIGRALLITIIGTLISLIPIIISTVIALLYLYGFSEPLLYVIISEPLLYVIIGVGVLIALVANLYVSCRLSLALPAAALKIDNFGLRASWQATKGHAWGLMGIYLLTLFVTSMASGILLGVTGAVIELSSLPNLLNFVPYAAILPFSIGIVTSLASFIYLQLGKPPVWIEESGSKS